MKQRYIFIVYSLRQLHMLINIIQNTLMNKKRNNKAMSHVFIQQISSSYVTGSDFCGLSLLRYSYVRIFIMFEQNKLHHAYVRYQKKH